MRKIPKLVDLPELKYFCTTESPGVFTGAVVLMVVHLLPDCPAFVRAFEKCGAEPQHILIVGVPYSTSHLLPENRQPQHSRVRATKW